MVDRNFVIAVLTTRRNLVMLVAGNIWGKFDVLEFSQCYLSEEKKISTISDHSGDKLI